MNTPFGKFDINEFQKFFTENDFVKTFQQNAEKFDARAMFDAQQKNLQAMMEANKTASEGYMKIFQEQTNALKDAVAETQTYIQDAVSKGADVDADSQVERARTAVEKGVANLTAWGEAAKNTSTEAFDVLAKRAQESVKELEDVAASLKKK